MQTGEPSRTALGAAIYRAHHQLADAGRVFHDPLAVPILGRMPELTDTFFDRDLHGQVRLLVAARSRFAEDALAEAVAAGTTQAVILGAGLDTFAYRNPHPRLRVFEIDHPDTQEWKRQRLRDADIAVPASLTYVPADFEHQTLDQALAATDFDPAVPAFVIWLGVTVYLTESAIQATLHYLGTLAAGSQLVLDYAEPVVPSTPEEHAAAEFRKQRLAQINERWLSFFSPEDIAGELHRAGFEVAEDLGPTATAVRYAGAAVDTPERPGPHILRAVVRG
ncbi:methyltransferase (TIGR00027 family) [Nocardia tenerifensis]|uniref:S-adenosyl-L-methionine-dependent methyltransferase n=1 Tax=Nocardia tenerifensis TaxID=228006 RepID=A0A318KH55_9NOCA|nr:class I SAM-dependent methyltransferase [Nocardia tenerifensis]PXX59722.1 methyltransferase (TIGR00027 family) [Nocardia tenerifensis]